MTKRTWPVAAAVAAAILAAGGCAAAPTSGSGGSTPGTSAIAPAQSTSPAPSSPAPAATSPAATSPAAPAVTVCITPVVTCNSSELKTEPKTLLLSGDGSVFATAITWSGWGTGTAQGTGTLKVDNCNPNCAQGTLTGYPATITLTALTPFQGGQAYGSMTISAPSDSYSRTYATNLVP